MQKIHSIPQRGNPQEMHRLRRPLGESPKNLQRRRTPQKILPTRKPGETFPFCTMNKYKMYY